MNTYLENTISKLIQNVSNCLDYSDLFQARDYADGFLDCLLHTQQINVVEFTEFKSDLQESFVYTHSMIRDGLWDLSLNEIGSKP